MNEWINKYRLSLKTAKRGQQDKAVSENVSDCLYLCGQPCVYGFISCILVLYVSAYWEYTLTFTTGSIWEHLFWATGFGNPLKRT